MNVLILGSGGREHALSWKISQSKDCKKVFVAPGNAGTAKTAENVNLNPSDFKAVAEFSQNNQINLIIVGPEEPIVKGIRDYFMKHDLLTEIAMLAPSAEGAKLEGSKVFSKKFMFKNKIPTAAYSTFDSTQLELAHRFVDTHQLPVVIKVDGLAAGKGVLICEERNEAKKAISGIFKDKKFGAAGNKVVIEEYLEGIELSVTILTDGNRYVILPNAKDYKRIGEGDKGLNTGGMGAVSPVPFADDAFMEKVKKRIIEPTIIGLKDASIDYRGFIFFGLMNVNGNPFLLEYNVRLGDPESEVILPRVKEDILPHLLNTAKGDLKVDQIKTDERFATTVMLVSGGYPEAYEKDKKIHGADEVEDSIVFHAGTKLSDNEVYTNGGRVLAITSMDKKLSNALTRSYENAAKIEFEGKAYRRDIGFDLDAN